VLFKAGAIYVVWKVCCKHLIGKLKGYVGDKTDDLRSYVYKKIIGRKKEKRSPGLDITDEVIEESDYR